MAHMKRVRIKGRLKTRRVKIEIVHGRKPKRDPRGGSRPGNPSGKRGGARPGAGRPKGSISKTSREIIRQAENSGLLPHVFMLHVMQVYCDRDVTDDKSGMIGDHKVTWEDVQWAVEKGANYFAPKLAATEFKGKIEERRVLELPPEVLKGLSRDELSVMEKVFGRMQSGTVSPHTNDNARGMNDDGSAYAAAIGDDG
jgi:hypothetical protein